MSHPQAARTLLDSRRGGCYTTANSPKLVGLPLWRPGFQVMVSCIIPDASLASVCIAEHPIMPRSSQDTSVSKRFWL
jgi:hypothetical protein